MNWRKQYANFIRKFPHKVGAEVGVYKGENSVSLLSNLPDIKLLYCIDFWGAYENYDIKDTPAKKNGIEDFDDVYDVFLHSIDDFMDRVEVVVGDSVSAANYIPDGVLDFVFIDANHSYEYVKRDILSWYPKVKGGGIVSGHDYVNDPSVIRYGVKLAVDELFPNKRLLGNIWWVKK